MVRRNAGVRWVLAALVLAAPLFGQDAAKSPEGLVIKAIRIEGLKRTKTYVVSRELVSRVGEPYLAANVVKDRINLEKLNIFVDIQADAAVEGNDVVLTYRFVEIWRFMPSVSIQITDENGIAAGVGLKLPNVLGRGVAFSGRVMGGGSTLAKVSLQNPWFTGYRVGYNFEYVYRDRENLVGDFMETAHELNFDVSAPIGEYFRFGGHLEYQDIRSDRAGVTLSPDNQDRSTRLGLYLNLDRRDTIIGTHEGWWAEIRASREMRIFAHASNFWQVDFDVRRYQPLPFTSRHQLGIYTLVTLRSGAVGTEIAPWQLFALGGTNTVRGWAYASREGKDQFIGTLEYSFTVLRPRLIRLPFGLRYRGGLALCLFGDVGSVWPEARGADLSHFIAGYGLGLRVLVPVVGVVRLDLGWGEGAALFHIGSFEKSVMARQRVR